jgi:hypothetical protein
VNGRWLQNTAEQEINDFELFVQNIVTLLISVGIDWHGMWHTWGCGKCIQHSILSVTQMQASRSLQIVQPCRTLECR